MGHWLTWPGRILGAMHLTPAGLCLLCSKAQLAISPASLPVNRPKPLPRSWSRPTPPSSCRDMETLPCLGRAPRCLLHALAHATWPDRTRRMGGPGASHAAPSASRAMCCLCCVAALCSANLELGSRHQEMCLPCSEAKLLHLWEARPSPEEAKQEPPLAHGSQATLGLVVLGGCVQQEVTFGGEHLHSCVICLLWGIPQAASHTPFCILPVSWCAEGTSGHSRGVVLLKGSCSSENFIEHAGSHSWNLEVLIQKTEMRPRSLHFSKASLLGHSDTVTQEP